jgi:hypothetical protein
MQTPHEIPRLPNLVFAPHADTARNRIRVLRQCTSTSPDSNHDRSDSCGDALQPVTPQPSAATAHATPSLKAQRSG